MFTIFSFPIWKAKYTQPPSPLMYTHLLGDWLQDFICYVLYLLSYMHNLDPSCISLLGLLLFPFADRTSWCSSGTRGSGNFPAWASLILELEAVLPHLARLLSFSLREKKRTFHLKLTFLNANPSTQESEAGGLSDQGQPLLHSETLFQT